MAEYVFTLRNVRKAHGDKVVLDNVTLSFLHGAKIGVVGPNGTGKSTAAEDHGRAREPTTATRSSTRARPSACSSRSRR